MSHTDDLLSYPNLPPSQSGMKGKCPRCGQGKLFSGYLTVAKSCQRCKLDFGFVDTGDGPAVFVISIVGIIAIIGVLVTEVMFEPAIWINMMIWLPVTVILCLLLLRPLKGLLIAQQYQRSALQGSMDNATAEEDAAQE